MHTHKKTVGLLILLMVVIMALAVTTGIGNQEQHTSTSAKRDDATPIQEGRMTDKQREHSKLYKGFGTGKKLKDLALEIPGGVKVKRNTPFPVGDPGQSTLTLVEFLKELACNADAVVIGVVTDKSSQLTDDGEFVFTDYELNIEQVLKDNEFAHLIPDISLTLTQPGGKIQLRGHIIEAEDAGFRPLAIGGRYALFLKFIPSTRAYASLNTTSSYELRNNKVKTQTDEALRPDLNNENTSTFVNKVRAVAAGGCISKGRQE